MTDHEIALAAAKDAREQAARASNPSKRAAWEEIAARWTQEAERFAPPQPSFASYEVLPDGSQPIRLSFQIKVF